MAEAIYLGAVSRGSAGFGIVFLDAPGCASCGDTLEEALAMGREALLGHLDSLREHGDPLPRPSVHTVADVDAWLYDEGDEREPWVGLFPVAIDAGEAHGDVPVSLPRTLVSELDAALPDARRFIIETTRRELDRLKKSA